MKSNKWITTPLVLALCGCSTVKEIQQDVRDKRDTATEAISSMQGKATTGAVWRTAQPKLTGEEIKVVAEEKLPDVFLKTFPYTTPGQSMTSIFEDISRIIGFKVIQTGAQTNNGAQGGMMQANMPAGQAGVQMQVEWAGTLRGLLDFIAQKSGFAWRYAGGQVEFFNEETRFFQVYLPKAARSVSASISLSGAGGGGGGGGAGGAAGGGGGSGGSQPTGNVSVTSSQTIDSYASIVSGIQGIINEGTSANAQAGMPQMQNRAVIANPELGMITVTARPAAMRRIAEYIEAINKRYARNVLVDVKVYNVNMSKEANAGFSANVLYQRLNRYGFALQGPGNLQPQSTPGLMQLSSTDPNNRFNGSTVLAQALQGLGEVSLVTSGTVNAVNGHPAPLQVADEITYAATSSVAQTVNAGTATAITPASRVVGFTANFIPQILGDNRILLEYQMTISSMQISQFTSGGATIQLPKVSSQSLQQQAFLRDGQTLVLFGFDQTRSSNDNSASPSSYSVSSRQERSMTVILMQVFGGSREEI
ncbi:type II secretion system protein GspD [Noviherbaspirillum galbum]|uniref:Type II/III secretion system secretin-like domain-containing protein n=1 Tax=Noviherbaspirillum galbum TaxID=2709383 RepID=A0A6B3SYV7_9BURK|nr:hypothetical protein [Noviherbaspirillum galbum]NEX63369.1 hypothetical protein [Noviherbaspirillum galbum]